MILAVQFVNWTDSQDAAAQSFDSQPVDPQRETLRYPEKLHRNADLSRLYTANRKSGTISIVDVESRQVISETKVAQRISDSFLLNDHQLFITDDVAHQVIVVAIEKDACQVQQKIDVRPYPVRLSLDDQKNIYVSSLWPRVVTKLSLQEDQWTREKELQLPFAPRMILPLNEQGKVLVADAFGGRLAVLTADSFTLDHVREFPAHNIRGMQLSADGEKVVFIHQMLNDLAVTNTNDIHWGLLMSNDARWLSVEGILDLKKDFYRNGHMQPIGEANRGGGDPSSVIISNEGHVAITMAATNEFSIGKEYEYSLIRTKVGQRPTSVVLSDDARFAYVANSYDDTISIVDTKHHEVTGTISLGPQRERDIVEQGELLFHKGLSMEGWMSCHSCHTDGHTNGMANDNFSDGSFGSSKRVLSLLGRNDTAPFGWRGLSDSMESQIKKSVKLTMRGRDLSDEQASALAAYINTLQVPESIDALQKTVNHKSVARGKKLFNQLDCASCHAPPSYTSADTYDVGLDDTEGNELFNPPSLLGIGHRESHFHDMRAKSLVDVFKVHKHQLERDLNKKERADLVAFLRSL